MTQNLCKDGVRFDDAVSNVCAGGPISRFCQGGVSYYDVAAAPVAPIAPPAGPFMDSCVAGDALNITHGTWGGTMPVALAVDAATPLPAGVTFTDNGDGTYTIGGTCPPAGTSTFTINGTNVAGTTSQPGQELVSTAAPVAPIPPAAGPFTDACAPGDALNITHGTWTGNSPITLAVDAATPLPAGVTFTDNGDGTYTIGGTCPPAGTTTYTINGTNVAGTTPQAGNQLVATAVVFDPLIATNDTVGGVAPGAVAVNVLDNDTLDGNPATLANVTITAVGAVPAELVFDAATGEVSAAPGATSGTYTMQYQICETAVPANCDTGDIEITVVELLRGWQSTPWEAVSDNRGSYLPNAEADARAYFGDVTPLGAPYAALAGGLPVLVNGGGLQNGNDSASGHPPDIADPAIPGPLTGPDDDTVLGQVFDDQFYVAAGDLGAVTVTGLSIVYGGSPTQFPENGASSATNSSVLNIGAGQTEIGTYDEVTDTITPVASGVIVPYGPGVMMMIRSTIPAGGSAGTQQVTADVRVHYSDSSIIYNYVSVTAN